MKKIAVLVFICFAASFFSACATISGAGKGIRKGIAEDAKAVPSAIMRADEWIRENLW